LSALTLGTLANASPQPSEVVVLCALHQLHEQAHFYTYADLSAAIERLHPDVLVVELTPADLKDKVEQKNKREYQNSVYPLLRQHNWATVALEPEGRRRTELIGWLRGAEQELQKTSPQKDEAFDTYNDTLQVSTLPMAKWRGRKRFLDRSLVCGQTLIPARTLRAAGRTRVGGLEPILPPANHQGCETESREAHRSDRRG